MGTPIVQMVREGHPPVTHDQAKASAQRLINSHFNNREEHARVSIPVRHDDDDVVVLAYINEQRAKLARAEKVIEAVRKVIPLYKGCRIHIYETELALAIDEYDRPSAPLAETMTQEDGTDAP